MFDCERSNMTKADWEYYRNHLDVKMGEIVHVYWHWNFGTTAKNREREIEGSLDWIDDRGIILDMATRDKRMNYKTLDSICSLCCAYEPDGDTRGITW